MDLLHQPVPHDQAARWIAKKPILARQAFDRLLPDLRARAFTITGVEAANVMQNVRDRIAEIPRGASWDEVKADIAAQISPWLDQPEDRPRDQGTKGPPPPSQRRAELLLRIHGYQAYTVAAEEVAERQRAAFPYAQYLSSQDDRVRESHQALDGLVVPADSPFWDRHTPPWEWGCRCNKVFLTADDVADMQKDDARKKPEAQRVLAGERLARLEKSNQVTIEGEGGMPQFVNVEPSKTFTFDRTTIRMTAEQLRPRYDAETFATFETWARQQPLGEDQGTVWQWLNAPAAGARTTGPLITGPQVQPPAAPPEVPAPTVPAPASLRPPVSASSAPPRQAPVSAALEVRTAGSHKPDIQAAIAAIDRVHDDGDLPPLPIIGSTGGSARGIYQMRRTDQAPVQIAIENAPQHWPALTTAHEIGHFLDHQVLGTRGQFASAQSEALAGFRQAVLGSRAVTEIRATFSVRQQEYYLSSHELWARAYAQYVAQKSGDPVLAAQLARARSGRLQPAVLQWTDDDFAPIAVAIDEVLRAKGWRTP